MANKKGINPVAAGVVGAAVGAVVGASAVVLSDEKNRKKISNKFNEYKEDGQQAYSNLKGKVEDLTSQGSDKVKAAKAAVKSKL